MNGAHVVLRRNARASLAVYGSIAASAEKVSLFAAGPLIAANLLQRVGVGFEGSAAGRSFDTTGSGGVRFDCACSCLRVCASVGVLTGRATSSTTRATDSPNWRIRIEIEASLLSPPNPTHAPSSVCTTVPSESSVTIRIRESM